MVEVKSEVQSNLGYLEGEKKKSKPASYKGFIYKRLEDSYLITN